MYCVAITLKMTKRIEQQICIKLCIKLEHYSSLHNVPAHASHLVQRFFGKTLNHSGDSAPLQPRFGALQLLAFPQTKITFERQEIETADEIQKNTMWQQMAIGRTV